MYKKANLASILRSVAVAIVAIFSISILNIASVPTALAADNYSAATDTYQETRNPNRVSTTTDELAKSKLNQEEEAKGESIYDRLVEKVDNQRDRDSAPNNTATRK